MRTGAFLEETLKYFISALVLRFGCFYPERDVTSVRCERGRSYAILRACKGDGSTQGAGLMYLKSGIGCSK